MLTFSKTKLFRNLETTAYCWQSLDADADDADAYAVKGSEDSFQANFFNNFFLFLLQKSGNNNVAGRAWMLMLNDADAYAEKGIGEKVKKANVFNNYFFSSEIWKRQRTASRAWTTTKACQRHL